MAVGVGTKTTVVFTTPAGFVAKVRDINISGEEREALRTSDMSTSDAHTFIPSDLYDPGSITVECFIDPALAEAVGIAPFAGVSANITIELQGVTAGSSDQWVVEGFVTSVEYNVPFEDLMTQTYTVKCTGTWART